jgi:hypothetical protein
MTTIVLAHFDGKRSLVLDQPVDLPIGTPLRVQVEALREEPEVSHPSSAKVTPAPHQWKPLDIQIDPELSNAIALDPEFNIEES